MKSKLSKLNLKFQNIYNLKILIFLLLIIFISLSLIFFGLVFENKYAKDFCIQDNINDLRYFLFDDEIDIEIDDKRLKEIYLNKNNSNKLKVQLIIDFESPFSNKFYKTTYKKLYLDFIETDLIDFEIIHLPLLEIHENSLNLSLLYECSKEDNKENLMFDYLFESKNKDINFILNNLNQSNFNKLKLINCLENKTYIEDIYLDLKYLEYLNIEHTPNLVIDSIVVSGAKPYKQIKNIILNKIENI